MKKLNFNKGFTIVELLIVFAIIAVLFSVVLVVLGSGRTKGQDSRVFSQIGQMNSQSYLFKGTTGTAYTVTTPYAISGSGITGEQAGGTAATGTLFNDTTLSNNSLYALARGLPNGTFIYYGWDGVDVNSSGRWFFIASISNGAFCNDYKSGKRLVTTGGPYNGTLSNWTATFTNTGNYLCN